MQNFRVTKLRVPVKVLVSDRVLESDVFLTPVAATHDGSETLSDLLNGQDEYLPIERGGEVTCVPREAIEVAWIAPSAGCVSSIDFPAPTEETVRITLRSGRALIGTMRYSRHADSSRLVDHLNGSPRFVALHQGARMALVNRAHIAFIAPEKATMRRERRRPRLRSRKR
jgi:hypothetical protein